MRAVTVLVTALTTMTAGAQTFLVEPDAYSNGAVLTNAHPAVALWTTGGDNVPVPAFPVTATDDNLDFAPTGANVFAHSNVPFFNDVRRLRMDFAAPVSLVELAFAGGNTVLQEFGRLEIYNAASQLLGSYNTALRHGGEVELMLLSRPQGDIQFAVAYTPTEGGSFGRFDALRFTVVPEPAAFALVGLGALALRRRRGHCAAAARHAIAVQSEVAVPASPDAAATSSSHTRGSNARPHSGQRPDATGSPRSG
ncbi:MAG: PEP-CTERM sorting domain-containing protein [Phycisphaerae bacterium]